MAAQKRITTFVTRPTAASARRSVFKIRAAPAIRRPNKDPHNAIRLMMNQIMATTPSADMFGSGEFFSGSHKLTKTRTAVASNPASKEPIPNREDERVLNLDINIYQDHKRSNGGVHAAAR